MRAFFGCTNLTNIRIPDTVTNIEENAFNGCSSLTSITIPEGVSEIKPRTFYSCENLQSVKLPKNLKTIESDSFYLCNNLTNLIIPPKVEQIDVQCFSKNTLLYIKSASIVPNYAEEEHCGYVITDIKSEKYVVDNHNYFILTVLPETTINEFQKNIDTKIGYKVVNTKEEQIEGQTFVTTGSKIVTDLGEEYVISVIGDLNKDGKITLSDISIERKYNLGIENLENELFLSGDINNDGKISLTDLSQLRKIYLGVEEIKNN